MSRLSMIFAATRVGASKKAAKPASAKRVDREGQEQAAYFEWLNAALPIAAEHAFHPANGGHRVKAVAGKLKAQGVRAGVPDIFIDLPRGAYHGLRIELKATPPNDAAVAPSQKEWHDRLNTAGYYAVVCKGWDVAREVTIAYMALPPFDGVARLAVLP